MTHRASGSRALNTGALARVEGEGAMRVEVRGGELVDVQLNIYEPPRFFEGFLRGRGFNEPADITARICGICPVAYQMSACHAIEDALGVTVDGPLRELRRLLYCGEWIESHTLHIHFLHAPDCLGHDSAIEMVGANRAAVAAFARDIVTVGDNLQRTIDAVTFEEGEEPDSRLKGLLEGVEMTERDLVNVLSRHGITRIDPKGEKFDPNRHEAVVQMPDPSVPAGLVAEVMQQGYMIGERVLRPAMVGVTAGGPRLVADPNADEQSDTGSNIDTPPGRRFAELARPMPPDTAPPRSVRMSPKRLSVTITS